MPKCSVRFFAFSARSLPFSNRHRSAMFLASPSEAALDGCVELPGSLLSLLGERLLLEALPQIAELWTWGLDMSCSVRVSEPRPVEGLEPPPLRFPQSGITIDDIDVGADLPVEENEVAG